MKHKTKTKQATKATKKVAEPMPPDDEARVAEADAARDEATDRRAVARARFEYYDTCDEAVSAAEEALAKASARRSTAVAMIIDQVGKGPFQWKGQRLWPTERKGKYYLRGEGRQQVFEVE